MKCAKLFALLLTLALMAALFAACETGDPAMKAAAGSYSGLYTKAVGDPDDSRDSSSPFSLTLEADGTGVHARDQMEFNVVWSLEGEKITLQETFIGITLDYTGTLRNDELHLFNGNPEDLWTVEYVYQKK